jgi:hypothetical protein
MSSVPELDTTFTLLGIGGARGILARTRAAYANCRTYRDSGESTTVVVMGPQPWERRTSIKRFRTAFERPQSLFFEYRDVGVGPESEWSRALVCAGPDGILTWSTLRIAQEPPKSIHAALYHLMCVSGGTSGTTPWLLVPTPERCPLPESHSAWIAGTDRLGGSECFRVRGHDRLGTPFDVWIDPRTHAVRRISETRTFAGGSRSGAGFTTQTVTTFEPVFDEPVDPASFRFVPPDGETR